MILLKKSKFIILGLLLFCLCFNYVCADDISGGISDAVQNNIDPATLVTLPLDDVTSLINDGASNDSDLLLVSAEQSRTTVGPSNSNGFKAVMLTLLGNYDTVITDYTYQSSSSGYYSHSISIERDWAWILSACVFMVIIYCTFRCLGGILCRR